MRPAILPALPALLFSLAAVTCTPPPLPPPAPVVPIPVGPPAKEAIASLIDDWHDAAAHADEDRYFAQLAEDAVFLGTDAKERWDKAAFRAYSHPHFAKGKAWAFKSIRRGITIDPSGVIAWFDEDLETPNLGPARGSGVLVKRGALWKISQYNLAITVPNEHFPAVKRAAAGEEAPVSPCPSPSVSVRGVVSFSGKPPVMKVPAKRKDAFFCKDKPVPHNAVIVKDGRLSDVLVSITNGSVKGTFVPPSKPAVVRELDCNYVPRVLGVMVGQEVAFVNADGTLHNINAYKRRETWFNQAEPKGAPPIVKQFEDAGIVRLTSDVYPWMRGFVAAIDHPFFMVTGVDGVFHLDAVPPGKYTLEAWHSIYGLKKTAVEVLAGKAAEVSFEYRGDEAEPPDNEGERKALF